MLRPGERERDLWSVAWMQGGEQLASWDFVFVRARAFSLATEGTACVRDRTLPLCRAAPDGRALQRAPHLLCDAHEAVAEDRQLDGVKRGGGACPSGRAVAFAR
eukprot:360341-Chlamydomonas_euryale.AAC.17